MAYKGVLDDIQRCVDLQEPERIPLFADSAEFDVRMVGMVYEEYCQSAEKMFECQRFAVETFGYDWCWLQIDDCIEFEMLGVGCVGEGNILRATHAYLPPIQETVQNLRMPDLKKEGRGPALLNAITKCKQYFKDTVCVTGRTAAPFSSAALLFGINETMLMLYDNPELLREALEFFTELQIEFGRAQIEAGADAIWFGDACAASSLISLDHYMEYAFPYADRVAEAYQKAGAWTLYMPGESNPAYIEKMCGLQHISALSIGEKIDMKQAKKIVQGKKCCMGNLDTVEVLLGKSRGEVIAETGHIVQSAASGGGYIFNTGDMVPRDVPEENMRAMIQTVRHYNVEK